MEDLRNENFSRSFIVKDEMKEFLEELVNKDELEFLDLASIKTGKENDDYFIEGLTNEGKTFKKQIFTVAIPSMEERSGDTAKGHQLMTIEQILNSMNNYWGLHKNKTCMALVRGEHVLTLNSDVYATIDENELFQTICDFLEEKFPEKHRFMLGNYTHSITEASFELKDALNESYKRNWVKTGLPSSLLDGTKVFLKFRTSDVAESAAIVRIEMSVMGTKFLLGEPINIIHRDGYGGIEKFKTSLDKTIVTINDELEALSNLMTIKLNYPEEAAIKAIKKCGLEKISKKAAKELVDDMMLASGSTAYTVYLFLHGFTTTSYGSALSEERKIRVVSALRRLLTTDWSKLDSPGPKTL